MRKHLTLFETSNDYKSFIYNELPANPNISYIVGGSIEYNCYISIKDFIINLLKNKKKLKFKDAEPHEYIDQETSLKSRISDVHDQIYHINISLPSKDDDINSRLENSTQESIQSVQQVRYINDSNDDNYQKIEFKYIDNNNVEQTVYVDISDIIEESFQVIYMYDEEMQEMKDVLITDTSQIVYLPMLGGEIFEHYCMNIIQFELYSPDDLFFADFEQLEYDGLVTADDNNEYHVFKISNKTEINIEYGEEYLNNDYLSKIRIFVTKATESHSSSYNNGYNVIDYPIFLGGIYDNGIYKIGNVNEDNENEYLINEGTQNAAYISSMRAEWPAINLAILGRRDFDIYGRMFDTQEEVQQNFVSGKEEYEKIMMCLNNNNYYLLIGDYERHFSTERINSLFNDNKNHNILERLFIKLPNSLMNRVFNKFDGYESAD